MSWKFKVSKYKNVAPRFPKKEGYISEISLGTLMQSCGNHIAAGSMYMAFNVESGGGGSLGVLPLDASGRQGQSLPVLPAHGDYVTDMNFSPFHDRVLATCSADNTVKVWSLPKKDTLSSDIGKVSPSVTLPLQERRVENVLWNPVADSVLAVSVSVSAKVFDISSGTEKYAVCSHGDQIQGISWRGSGTTIVTTCKDKIIRIIDPRSSSVSQECSGHGSPRDSRVVWLGDSDMVLTTGFNSSRSREIKLWDARSMKSAVHTTDRDTNTGVLMPFYDEDTNMLYVIGQADVTMPYYEVSSTSPYLTLNSVERCEQVKGAAMISKRAVNVMEGEVNRLLLLVQNAVIPTPCIVPRKQYNDFHADVFPDTKCGTPALSAEQWFEGQDGQVALMSLDPAKRANKPVVRVPPVKKVTSSAPASSSSQAAKKSTSPSQSDSVKSGEVTLPEVGTSQPKQAGAGDRNSQEAEQRNPWENKQSTASKFFESMHQSKCKHMKGVTEHRSKHIENVRRLCRTLPGESDLFYANTKRCAVPTEGAGGLIAILELTKPGRLPDVGVPVLQNGSKLNDMAWDPFDDTRLLAACENAKVYVWSIPESGLTETLSDPSSYLMGHTEKLYFVKFHPLAKDVVMTSAYDMTVKIWDLTDNSVKIDITCHEDQVYCAEWSPDGKLIATVSKDEKIRIIDPRNGASVLKEGQGPSGSRGARIVWTADMKFLVVSAFEKTSRYLYVYGVDDISKPLQSVELDRSPAILVPYYDEGTSTIFFTGRGDGSLSAFEISEEPPHLFPLAGTKFDSLHQGFALMPKSACDVTKAEIARAWRLTQTTIEPISFTVPRVKLEYFQDDLFPATPVKDKPAMTSQEWFSGVNREPVMMNLCPPGMKLLSQAPVEAPKAKKYDSYNPDTYKTDQQKKEELLSAMTNKLSLNEEPLPQDTAEGVDSDEWGDD